jgi:hypothetical protein
VCVLLGDGGLLLCSGGVYFWSVLGLLLGNDNNGVVFSLGSVPWWYFLWGPFRGYISLLASGVVTGREGSLLL